MSAACTLSQAVGKKAACEALAVPRATFYRHMSPEVLSGRKAPSCPRVDPHRSREKDGDRYPAFRAFPG